MVFYNRKCFPNIDADSCIIKYLKEVDFIRVFAYCINAWHETIAYDQFSIGVFEEGKKEIGDV